MLRKVLVCAVVMVSLSIVATTRAATHRHIQAVDANGVGTFDSTGGYSFTGVILNNPEAMMDSTASGVGMGGQWQIFVQGIGGDNAGTALWMGQNYGRLPWLDHPLDSYTDAAWQAEMGRVNYSGGNQLRKGDLIQVTAARSSSYGGKTNCTEGHDIDPASDFTISLITANYGLPTATLIPSLNALKDAADNDIFDATRNSGGELYQGTRVRLNGLSLTDAAGWTGEAWDDRLCTVTDETGKTFTLRMPRASVVDLGGAPAGEFDVIGIMNQESGSGADGTFGYELIVTDVVVPEPASVAILALAGAALLKRRRNG